MKPHSAEPHVPPAVARDVSDRLAAAKLWLVSTSSGTGCGNMPYLSVALYALVPVPTPRVERMTVDQYWRLYANPAWVLASDIPDIAGQLAHLTWHLLAAHPDRAVDLGVDRSTADSWTRATDAVIADLLADIPTQLPGTAKLGLEPGRSAEEYFARLSCLPAAGSPANIDAPPASPAPATARDVDNHGPESPDAGQRQSPDSPESPNAVDGCGSGCDGHARGYELPPTSGFGAISQTAAEGIRKRVAIEFRAHMPIAGTLPGEWERWVQDTLEPVVPWTQVLAAAVRRGIGWAHGHADYTYTRISRRQAAAGSVILPATRRPVPEVAVVLDTSGSVDDGLLAQSLGEVNGVLAGLGVTGRSVTVLATDAIVQATTRVRSAADAVVPGGGGTDMGAGIQAALDLRPRPTLIVILTDGYTPWPEIPPPIPVVVTLTGRTRAELPPTPDWVQRVECVLD